MHTSENLLHFLPDRLTSLLQQKATLRLLNAEQEEQLRLPADWFCFSSTRQEGLVGSIKKGGEVHQYHSVKLPNNREQKSRSDVIFNRSGSLAKQKVVIFPRNGPYSTKGSH